MIALVTNFSLVETRLSDPDGECPTLDNRMCDFFLKITFLRQEIIVSMKNRITIKGRSIYLRFTYMYGAVLKGVHFRGTEKKLL